MIKNYLLVKVSCKTSKFDIRIHYFENSDLYGNLLLLHLVYNATKVMHGHPGHPFPFNIVFNKYNLESKNITSRDLLTLPAGNPLPFHLSFVLTIYPSIIIINWLINFVVSIIYPLA